ncbi:MFS transporter [Kitasatospora sp. MMS16-BH015]|uniref:MFS transporter n=1 Tax=Kitasatospora sp. MMS16-BH015 TaxID=2018025 RepID=UPI000CA23622|nr:MFS transporter [Kitasatospora sp. MMS16-BH015]AUG78773.1 MFS transporter [Kitasatospora sp. MMS16-BH015]
MADGALLRRSGEFRSYWSGFTLSMLGSSVSQLAFPLLVLSLGASTTEAGALATCLLLLGLVTRLPGGALVDRFDVKRLMIGADLVRCLALGSIPLAQAFGVLGYPQLLVVAAVQGVAGSVFGPASSIALRDVVAEADLPEALGKIQLSTATTGLLGPFLGGWLFVQWSMLPFLADSASFLASVLLVGRLRLPYRQPAARTGADGRESALAGVKWMLGQRSLLRALLFAATFNVIGTGLTLPLVVSLRQAGASGTSIGAVTAGLGVGSVLGALAATRITRLLSPGQLLVLVGFVWSAGFAVLITVPGPWVTGLVLVAVGLLGPPCSIVVQRAILVLTPRDLMGRVIGAQGLLLRGLPALGPIAIGAVLQGYGVRSAWLAMTLACLVTTLLTAGPLLRDRTLASVSAEPSDQQDADDDASSALRPDSAVETGA